MCPFLRTAQGVLAHSPRLWGNAPFRDVVILTPKYIKINSIPTAFESQRERITNAFGTHSMGGNDNGSKQNARYAGY